MFRPGILLILLMATLGLSRGQSFSLDANFRPVLSGSLDGDLTMAYSVATDAEGRIVVVGSFTNVNGLERSGVARLRGDGSVDESFDAGAGPNGTVWSVAVDEAQRIVIGGEFTTWNGEPSGPIVRLLPTGAMDDSFLLNGASTIVPDRTPVVVEVYLTAGNDILVAGAFTHYFGVLRPFLARLSESGALDESYAPDPQNLVIAISDSREFEGSVYVAGGFRDLANQPRVAAGRLDQNGILDSAFKPPFATGDIAWDIAEAAGSKVYVGGDFAAYVRRFDLAGALDGSFSPSFAVNENNWVAAVLPIGNRVLVGGHFDGVNGQARRSVVLLNGDGSVDEQFGSSGANDLVNDLAFDGDGNVLVIGGFTMIDGEARTGLARYLRMKPALSAPELLDGEIRFSFPSVLGSTYQIQATSDLLGDWTDVQRVDGTGDEIMVTQPVDGDYKFYRLEEL